MPRDATTLADVREPTLSIVCEPCGRRGRYNVERLIAAHGAPETIATDDLVTMLAAADFARASLVWLEEHIVDRLAAIAARREL
jgi:hypothetical protein